MSASSVAALKEARAILGGERDKFRVVWDEQASDADRRLLLSISGLSGVAISSFATVAWCDLTAERRSEIKRRFAAWRRWSEYLL